MEAWQFGCGFDYTTSEAEPVPHTLLDRARAAVAEVRTKQAQKTSATKSP